MLSRIVRASTLIRRGNTSIIKKPSSFYEIYESVPSETFDLMLSDINNDGLKDIGDKTGIKNLSGGSFSSSPFPVQGVIYGLNKRLMICLNCRSAEKLNSPILKVWFLTDTGSYLTFLTVETMENLAYSEVMPSFMEVCIQDPKIAVVCYPSHSHFKDANVLGMQTMEQMGLSIENMN